MLKRVSETVGVAVKLMDVSGNLPSPGAELVAGPHIGELTEQLTVARAAVVSLTAKVLDL